MPVTAGFKMLKRLSNHINRKFQRLLDQMILSTLIFLVLGFTMICIYAITLNIGFMVILWVFGLIYVIGYFSDALIFGKMVEDLDQDSLSRTIYLSKSYFDL